MSCFTICNYTHAYIKKVANRVSKKNGVESYAYSLKSTLAESGDKFSGKPSTYHFSSRYLYNLRGGQEDS
jgi:hypothetical protein